MIRIVSTFLFLVFITVNCFATCNLSVTNGSGVIGITKEIPIEVNMVPNGEKVCAIQFDVVFDPQNLEISNITVGSAANDASKQVEFALVAQDKVRLLIYGINQNLMSTGTVANLVFKFAPRPSITTTSITLSANYVCDSSATLAPSALTNGIITINAPDYAPNLSNVKAYPNPFKIYQGQRHVLFMNVSAGSKVKIFTVSGELVSELNEQSGGMIEWLGKNDDGKDVASGTYLYVVTNNEGEKKTGKIVVIR